MNRKHIVIAAALLAAFAAARGFAQMRITAQQLVNRFESMAGRVEEFESRTRTLKSIENQSMAYFYRLQDDAATLVNDYSFYAANGGELTQEQASRIMDAMRRITNATDQTRRNFERLGYTP
jgi:hypothetical protein